MKQALIYALKIWQTGVWITLVGWWILDYKHEDSDTLKMKAAWAALTEGVTLLYFILLSIMVFLLCRSSLERQAIKWLLTIGSFFIVVVPFFVAECLTMSWESVYADRTFQCDITYMLVTCGCLWFYKLKPVGDVVSTTNN